MTTTTTALQQSMLDLVVAPAQPAIRQRQRGARTTDDRARQLREALAACHLDLPKLRRLAAMGEDIRQVIADNGTPSPEIAALLDTLTAMLRPTHREQIKSPADLAALLMVDMSHLDQEQLRVVCLDTKNRRRPDRAGQAALRCCWRPAQRSGRAGGRWPHANAPPALRPIRNQHQGHRGRRISDHPDHRGSRRPDAVFPPRLLRELIDHVAYAAATEPTRPVLAGVLVRLNGTTATFVAVDGLRLAARTATLPEPVVEPIEVSSRAAR